MAWYVDPMAFWTYNDSQAQNNAVEIYNQLSGYGFGYNAICGILGNIGHESGYNPWKWQIYTGTTADILSTNDTYLITHRTGHAYGLFQHDPASDYIYSPIAQAQANYGPNFSNRQGNQLDGSAQLYNLEYYCIPTLGAWIPTTAYPMSYAQFKSSSQSADYLALAWLYEYERGTYSQARVTNAIWWYNNLSSLIGPTPPTPPTPPSPPTPAGNFGKMKFIYYLKRKW